MVIPKQISGTSPQPDGSKTAEPQRPHSGLAAALHALAPKREAICRQCEWSQASVSRCTRPRTHDFDVCYSCASREFPWLRIAKCPNWK
jgi:hypothetical protein